ncbi:MAG: diguanylate cyclase [Myxococcales bacterium]|nr:diguanylate cyclase [Myxococcales bacterium]MCB9644130.1 diguanylate cyclase [Myxococcales bacterium]
MQEQSFSQDPDRWIAQLLQQQNLSTPQLFETAFETAMQVTRLPFARVARLRHETHLRMEALVDSIGLKYQAGHEFPVDQLLDGEVIRRQDALAIPDLMASPFARHPEVLASGVRSYVGIPLWQRNQQIYGVLSLVDQKPHQWGAEALLRASMIGRWLGHEIELRQLSRELTTKSHRLASMAQELQRLQNQVEQGSIRDTVTDLLNNRYFNKLLQTEAARAQRHAYPLSLLLLFPDSYPRHSQQWGMDFGATMLRSIGVLLRRHLRTIDNAARYTEEMFAILLPQTDISGSAIVANRIRTTIGGHRFNTPSGETIQTTGSLGISGLNVQDDDPAAGMISRARRALEQARKAGGNRVIVASSTPQA